MWTGTKKVRLISRLKAGCKSSAQKRKAIAPLYYIGSGGWIRTSDLRVMGTMWL